MCSQVRWFAVRFAALLCVAATISVIFPPASAEAADDGFVSIFDGKTLKGWDGNPKFWSVKDGTITGQTTKENPTKGNTFIIWTGGQTGDFELKLQYCIVHGNSGIQYRSFKLKNGADKWRIGGYQADFEAGDRYSGILYGEHYRGILCDRGQKTELSRNGGKFTKKVVGKVGDSKAIQKKIRKEDWNDYHIVAKGFHFVHRINGVLTADCTDNDKKMRRASGLLALQLHAGPPMTVQFRKIRIKRLVKSDRKGAFRLRLRNIPLQIDVDRGGVRIDVKGIKIRVSKRARNEKVQSSPLIVRIEKGRVLFLGKVITVKQLGVQLRKIKKDSPNQVVLIRANPDVASGNVDAVFQAFKLAGITEIKLEVRRQKTKKIVLIAGRKSHGYGAHEHKAGCLLLAKALNGSGLPVTAVVVTGGWPKDASVLNDAATIVIYADGGGRHPFNAHLQELNALMKKGVGMVCIHYGVEVPKGKSGQAFLDWTGGYFEANWSVNPHWAANYKKLPRHQITRGVKPFRINDEWYYHMRFREKMKGVTPILTDLPPKSTLRRKDGPHSGNKFVRAEIAKGVPQHMAWARQRPDGGRGFGFTGGHFHWNWGHNQFRKLMLNAIVWTARVEVPKTGVPSKPLTAEDLTANQDYSPRKNFNPARIQAMIDSWNR